MSTLSSTIWVLLVLLLYWEIYYMSKKTFLSVNLDFVASFMVFLTLLSTIVCMKTANHLTTTHSLSKMILLLLLLFMFLMFTLDQILLMYLFFELSLLPIMAMIFMWGYQPERVKAIFYMAIYTILASLPLLCVILALFLNFSTLSWSLLLLSHPCFSINVWLMVASLAFFVKLPLFTVHLWLPKAHVEAPPAGSMILAAIMLKMGVYGLWRTLSIFSFENSGVLTFMLSLSVLGSVYICILCLRTQDFKKVIALSSVSHMSLLAAALFVFKGVWLGFLSCLLLSFAHGLISSALFQFSGVLYTLFKSRSVLTLKSAYMLNGLLSSVLMISLLLNFSVPPSLNFISEILPLTNLIVFNYGFSIGLVLLVLTTSTYCLVLILMLMTGAKTLALPLHSYKMSTLSDSGVLILISFVLFFSLF